MTRGESFLSTQKKEKMRVCSIQEGGVKKGERPFFEKGKKEQREITGLATGGRKTKPQKAACVAAEGGFRGGIHRRAPQKGAGTGKETSRPGGGLDCCEKKGGSLEGNYELFWKRGERKEHQTRKRGGKIGGQKQKKKKKTNR